MREALVPLRDKRIRCKGIFVKFGTRPSFKKGPPVRTFLLRNVTDTYGRQLCDHLWFNLGRAFALLHMQPGDVVAFDGRVATYKKGYEGNGDRPAFDYRLKFPTNVRKLNAPAPLFDTHNQQQEDHHHGNHVIVSR